MNLEQDNIELSRKIFGGLKLAYSKLYKERAAKNETVVISVNGEIRHVPAKDILRDLDKK